MGPLRENRDCWGRTLGNIWGASRTPTARPHFPGLGAGLSRPAAAGGLHPRGDPDRAPARRHRARGHRAGAGGDTGTRGGATSSIREQLKRFWGFFSPQSRPPSCQLGLCGVFYSATMVPGGPEPLSLELGIGSAADATAQGLPVSDGELGTRSGGIGDNVTPRVGSGKGVGEAGGKSWELLVSVIVK